jgi:formylmethanofuran dehydrogenase subunit A
MKRAFLSLAVVLVLGLFLTSVSYAHTPLCSCSDEGDGTILCEGGFSDGSSAAGVKMKVVDASGKTLVEGKMNEDSEFTFKKPNVPYTVIFDAGPGHVVKVPSKDITE